MKRNHDGFGAAGGSRLLGMAALAVTVLVAAGASGDGFAADGEDRAFAPSALLAIDRNRATVADRIVAEWGDKLVEADAGVTREQLRDMLYAMRADQLLAASLAGTLNGLRDVLAGSISAAGRPVASIRVAGADPASLGSPSEDLVYTPVNPCRLFDTRVSQGGLGPLLPNVRRTYGATAPVTNQGGPGGCAAVAGSAVALIQIGTLTPSGNGLLQGGPQGVASFPNALILYQPGDQYGTAVAMPLNAANGRFDLQVQFAQTEAYGDLLGYFAPPESTALECAPQQQAVQVNHGTFEDVSASCAGGYTLTGGGCVFFNLDGSAAAQNTVVINRSTQTRDPGTGAWQNTWSCRMTNNDPAIDFRIAARATCCRVPGR